MIKNQEVIDRAFKKMLDKLEIDSNYLNWNNSFNVYTCGNNLLVHKMLYQHRGSLSYFKGIVNFILKNKSVKLSLENLNSSTCLMIIKKGSENRNDYRWIVLDSLNNEVWKFYCLHGSGKYSYEREVLTLQKLNKQGISGVPNLLEKGTFDKDNLGYLKTNYVKDPISTIYRKNLSDALMLKKLIPKMFEIYVGMGIRVEELDNLMAVNDEFCMKEEGVYTKKIYQKLKELNRDSKIIESFVHGDLNESNIRKLDNTIFIFDWGAAHINSIFYDFLVREIRLYKEKKNFHESKILGVLSKPDIKELNFKLSGQWLLLKDWIKENYNVEMTVETILANCYWSILSIAKEMDIEGLSRNQLDTKESFVDWLVSSWN